MKSYYILSLLLFLASCKNDETTNETQSIESSEITLTEAQFKSADIKTAEIEVKKMSGLLHVNGIIDVPPQNMYSVSAPMGGYLISTHLLPGMHVRKGEVIATIEDQQFINLQQEYLTVQSKLVYAKTELDRQSDLNKNQASSDKVLQQTQMEYNSLRISSKALSEKLKMININPNNLTEGNLSKSIKMYSSFDGYVATVNVNIGKYINPTDVLFELVNPSDIHLNLKVFEKDVAKLSIGQKLFAYTNSDPLKKYDCEIILISRNINADGTIEVHCHFNNYGKSLLPGMYMNADVEINSGTITAVPEESIVNFEGKNYVFTLLGTRQYKMVQVEAGIKENGFIEINHGQELNDKEIVTKGAYTLLMALKNVEDE